METKAVRLYGKKDLRLETFTLPSLGKDEILAEVVTDSLCMSTYKAAVAAEDHKKVPNDIAENPIIIGHEFCGTILEVGEKWKDQFHPGDKFCIQPNIGGSSKLAPGYSFRYIGGDATKIIIMNQVMENGSLLPFKGDTFFEGSLVEPLSCVVGAFHANYHLKELYSYEHVMGIKEGGNLAVLGATGPMGFLAIDLALHGEKRPKLLVVTGRTQSKLDMVKKLYPPEEAEKCGVTLLYLNTSDKEDIAQYLRSFTEGKGFDDVFLFAPAKDMVTYGEKILGYDGCLNFFSGPSDSDFSAEVNFYNVHYNATHFVGTSGGNTEDMKEAIQLIESGRVNVAKITTHILGLDSVAETTLKLPELTGGKKIVYTQKSFPLTEIKNIIEEKTLCDSIRKYDGLWNKEAEDYILKNAPSI